MHVNISRFYTNRYTATLGLLKIAGVSHLPIFTLENPWRDNKVNVSCIPEGEYECKPFSGYKYEDVYQVMNVPDRTHILFHVGNDPYDTRGCILIGLSVDVGKPLPMIGYSKKAMTLFHEKIGNNNFSLSIKNHNFVTSPTKNIRED